MLGDVANFSSLDLSPDGKSVVVTRSKNLWIHEIARTPATRFTFGSHDAFGVWTRDREHIAYSSEARGPGDLYSKPADGSKGEELLYADGAAPDGRWVAYQSDESGRNEIYVAAFPGPGGKHQISTGGGSYPRWRADGKEIFYIGPNGTLIEAEISARLHNIEVGAVHLLPIPALVNPLVYVRRLPRRPALPRRRTTRTAAFRAPDARSELDRAAEKKTESQTEVYAFKEVGMAVRNAGGGCDVRARSERRTGSPSPQKEFPRT